MNTYGIELKRVTEKFMDAAFIVAKQEKEGGYSEKILATGEKYNFKRRSEFINRELNILLANDPMSENYRVKYTHIDVIADFPYCTVNCYTRETDDPIFVFSVNLFDYENLMEECK